MDTFTPKGHIRGPIMPIQILKSCELSLGAKVLYNALIYFAGDKNFCWATHSTLAKFICCSVSSIKNYLNELKIVGLIRVGKGGFGVCRYYFLRPAWASDSIDRDDTPRHGESGHDKSKSGADYPEEPSSGADYGYKFNCKNLKPNNPPYPPKPLGKSDHAGNVKKRGGGGNYFSVNQEFEKFWAAYPRKEAKELARSVWFKLHRQGNIPVLSSLISVLEKFKVCGQWLKEHGRYIPQCVNWLKGRRWLDENLDAAVQFTPEEKISQERRLRLCSRLQAEEAERAARQRAESARLRPVFDAFLSCFSECGNSGPAWGLWHLLHVQGKAPRAQDVPSNPGMGVLDFLRNWQREVALA
ncbi:MULTISPECIES: helix-turn-helix domain-containing protein [unclassified Desulfovibrio]|uniref:helix-turn-helix domain-containing protein n=1 Tax=unclassified Desulfovibrio TaxID=2593640 RepID=UPI0013E9A610|nr:MULTISPECIES: helix-turn-helix domain-containing protein [unclassified Desulfovibrio]